MDSEQFVLLYLRDYICSNFESLITKTELCDVIFEVGNEFNKKQFYAVKALFAIHSEIFYQLLYSKSKSSQKRNDGICTIQILDIEPDAMEYLRALFYGLNPSITLKNIIPIYHASNIYEIEELKQYCLQFLYSIIPTKDDMNIFLSLLNQLIYYQYDDMIMDILNNLQLTHYHFHSMLQMDDESKIFSNSPFKLIQQLLFNNDHNLFGDHITQENKWSACMKWSLFQSKKIQNTKKHQNGSNKISKIDKFSSVEHQLKGNKYLKQFIKFFDFESFDSEFFHSNVAKLKILDDQLALEMLNFHCNGLLNRIDDKYDNIVMNYRDGHHALTGNLSQQQQPSTSVESSSIIKIQHYSGGYLCVDEYNDNNIKIKFANSIKDDYYEWIGIEDQNGFWKFQNVATSKFLTVTPKLKGSDTSDVLKCNDVDGKSLFCIFMIHITPWKHCKFEPIFIHPNYFLSVKDKNIQLSTKNGLYEEFKMIPISNEDNKIQVKDNIDNDIKDDDQENMNDVQYKSTLTPRKNALLFESNNNHRKGSLSTFNFGQELKQLKESDHDNDTDNDEVKNADNKEHIKSRNGSIIDHPLADNNATKEASKWTGDKQLTIEDKFGSYFLAIKGLHSTSCTANKVMDDLSEWIVQFNCDSKDLVRFKNSKSNKYLRISNNGFRIDCGGDEDDKHCIFKISHSEHDWNLCRLESVEYHGYCLGLSENGVTVSHDVATDSLIYVKVE